MTSENVMSKSNEVFSKHNGLYSVGGRL